MLPEEDKLLDEELDDDFAPGLPTDDVEAEPEEVETEVESEDEEPSYGASVKKRIAKETFKRRDAERLAAAREAQFQTAAAELREMKARLAEVEKVSHQAAEKEFEAEREETKARLRKAAEEGDTEAQVRETERLTSQEIDRRQAEYAKRRRAEKEAAAPAGAPEINPLAETWKLKHSDWYGKKGFERHTELVNSLDDGVYKAGFHPGTAEYFDELDRRIEAKFGTTKLAEVKPRAKSPVADPQRGGRPAETASSLTKRELEVAQKFNLTGDPKAMKRYKAEIAKSKRAQS